MDKGINSLLETKTEQRKLLTLSEKERRKYLRNKERQLRKFQELLYSRPSMNKSQQDIALMLAADRLRDLDLTTRKTNKNRPTIESLDSEIQRIRTEKQMQQLNFANGGDTMDIKQQTQNVAAQGRYGDSMLLHVNPAEVKGLASAMPITVNPETGQPEAFLPFLAPLAGSLLGGSLLGGALGSTLLGSAVGSGLAQYAATGDLKKGLLAGLTGYGVGTALQTASGAAGASAATQAATDAATTAGTLGDVATQELIQSAGTQAGGEALKTASTLAPATATTAATGTPFANLKSVFNPAAISETTAATAPDLLTAGTTVDPTLGTSFGNLATGLTDPMAYIPAGIGMGATGIMESQEAFERMLGESEEAYRKRREDMYRNNPEPILYSAEGGRTGYYEGGRFGEIPDNIGGNLPQIFAPARQAYDVNPDFMAGFAPETMYFNPATISAPASGLQAGAPPIGLDTYEGSKGGYGGRQASIAPQTTIDPYSAYTGQPPAGLEFTNTPIPMPIQPMPELPVPPVLPPDFDPIIGIPRMPGIFDLDAFRAEYAKTNPTPPGGGKAAGAKRRAAYETDLMDAFDDYQNITTSVPELITAPPIQYTNMPSNNAFGMTGEDLGLPMGMETPMPEQVMPQMPIAPTSPFSLEELGMLDFSQLDRNTGGDTNVQVNKLPEGLKAMYDSGEKGREGVEKIAAKTDKFEEGGMTDIQSDPLTQEVTMFILGETDNEQALNDFITKYGSDAFMQLREAVLQSIVPNAQTQGLIRGDGEGGMDDDLRGMIGDKERIAVSQDEFIVPADVVSMLGDGSSDAGSKELYDMMDRVRKEKTGTTKQAPRLANAGGLLPA